MKPLRWIAMLATATALSGCVAGAIDTSASFNLDNTTQSDQEFAFTEADFGASPDDSDTSEQASATVEGEAEADLAALEEPEAQGDIDEAEAEADLAAAEAETEVAYDVASAAAETGPITEADSVDPVTARINVASGAGTGPTPPPAPLIKQNNERSGGLMALFGSSRAPRPAASTGASLAEARQNPVVTTSNTGKEPRPVVATASATGSLATLPGVDRERALGIKQDGGSSSADLYSSRPVQVASAAGLARLTPNGLRTQTDNVDVACLKPALVRVLKQVEQHYGKPVIVTSGFRSPPRNRRAGGAKNSLHMYCSAADIQIEGVSKWELAEELRSMPGRGGVGTYCHTKSVHVDIGPQRDWNWACRR